MMRICSRGDCQQKTVVNVINLFRVVHDPGYFKPEEKLKWQHGGGNHRQDVEAAIPCCLNCLSSLLFLLLFLQNPERPFIHYKSDFLAAHVLICLASHGDLYPWILKYAACM